MKRNPGRIHFFILRLSTKTPYFIFVSRYHYTKGIIEKVIKKLRKNIEKQMKTRENDDNRQLTIEIKTSKNVRPEIPEKCPKLRGISQKNRGKTTKKP